MANWKYIGFDKNRNKLAGQIEAESEREVRKLLRAQGIRPKEIISPSILELDLGEWMVDQGLAPPFTRLDLLNFTRQLSVMLDAGVPILQCLEILYKSQKNLNFKRIIKKISDDVGAGKSFSEALEGKKGFDNLYCNLVRAGETGGILDEILSKLVEFMEKQEKTKSQIKSAMTYPAIVVLVGIGVIYGLMVFVVPKFTEMLDDSGQEIPFITQLVVDTSNFMGEYAMLIFLVMVISIVFLKRAINTPEGKPIFDKFMMKMPIFGDIIIKGNLTSFTRTMATMLGAGVALIDALDICTKTIDNTVIAQDLQVVKKQVTQGKTLTEPLLRIEYFPDMVAQMVKVGEQTGEVDNMLTKCSAIFEEDVNYAVENMTKLIEPIIIVVLGGIVAVILVAMYLPIFMSAGGVG